MGVGGVERGAEGAGEGGVRDRLAGRPPPETSISRNREISHSGWGVRDARTEIRNHWKHASVYAFICLFIIIIISFIDFCYHGHHYNN